MATTCPADWRRRSRSGSARIAVVLLGLVLAGCNSSPEDAVPAGKRKVESNGGRYTVELVTSPATVVVNQPFDVAITIVPRSGTANLEALVDARMPAHFHGMNRVPKITRGAGNSWKAEGLLFHMSGHWELYVDITEGGATERAQVDIDLK